MSKNWYRKKAQSEQEKKRKEKKISRTNNKMAKQNETISSK